MDTYSSISVSLNSKNREMTRRINGSLNKTSRLCFWIPEIDRFTLRCVILVSITSILEGLDHGLAPGFAVVTFAVSHNIKRFDPVVYVIILACLYPIASLTAGGASDWIGRRYTLLFSLVIFFVGSLITAVTQNFVAFLFGRLLVSTGIAFAHTITPVYITELSPKSTRGFLTTFIEIFLNVGALLGEILAYSLSKVPKRLGERAMLGFETIPSLLLMASVALALPESPAWLVSRGRLDEAKQVFSKTSYNEEETALLVSQIKNEAVSETKWLDWTGWKMILLRPSPSVRRSLIAIVGVNFFKNSTGKDFVQMLILMLLIQARITNERDRLLVTIVIGLIQIGVILISGVLMDRVGRRPLLLASIIGLIPSLVGLGLGWKITNYRDKPIWAVTLSLVMFLSYTVFFSIGLGPITWVYSSEVFPLNLRAQGTSLGSAVGWSTRGAMFLSYLLLLAATIRMAILFFVFAGVATMGLLFFYGLVPETLDKSPRRVNGQSEGIAVSQPPIVENTTRSKKLSKSATFPMPTLLSQNFSFLNSTFRMYA